MTEKNTYTIPEPVKMKDRQREDGTESSDTMNVSPLSEGSLQNLLSSLYDLFKEFRNPDGAVERSLADTGSFFQAASAGVYAIDGDSQCRVLWHWENSDACHPALKSSGRITKETSFVWDSIRKSGVVQISKSASGSETGEDLHRLLDLTGWSSLISVPLSEESDKNEFLLFHDIPIDRMPGPGEMAMLVVFAGFLGTVYSRIKAEGSMAKGRKRYDAIVEGQIDFVHTLDPCHRITFANRAFCNHFGVPKEDITGRYFPDLLPETERDSMKEQLLRLSPEIPISFIEGRTELPSGGIIWQKWMIRGIFGEEGKLLEILGVGRDITRRKMVENDLKSSIETLQNNFEATINGMGKIIEIKDPYTAGHQQNVALLSRSIAEEMHLSHDQIESIYYASLVHDIGKIQIPSEILNKPGKLNDLEYSLVKNHPIYSSVILETVDFPWPIADIVLQHHERMNGGGYPKGIMGDDIMIEARIMGVADVVEAMTSHRPYRISLGIDKALEEIETYSGIFYDPEVVKICILLFREKGFSFLGEPGAEQPLSGPF